MFGWFRPTCPCDPSAKQWVEKRLAWLVKQFGLHIMLERAVVLPTPEFFPDDWDGSPQAARRMFSRVCEYMGVAEDDVELELFNHLDPTSGFAAGTWSGAGDDIEPEKFDHFDPISGFATGKWSGAKERWRKGVIRLERSTLDRPADLVGTMAHELAHQLLLGQGRLDADAFDNELLTDLTAAYHGFGVFLANNPRKSTGELHYWPGTRLRRPEYLSEPMLGYAMAHIAWFRDEDWPTWAGHLRWAPRGVFKQGLRFLQQTHDSSLQPVRFRS
jgi:hypothetical protein